jgi:catechol 2,3-dioxygenase-like lactoylglutathione lyase family enzyme
MIGYTLVGANDLAAARSFYDALFDSVGIGVLTEFPNGAFVYGKSWKQPMFGVGKPHDGGAATFGNGTMIAIVFDSRAHVDAIHARATELGGKDEGGPGVRGEDGDQAFYGAYFRDPDGNKLCAFAMGPG